MAKKFICTKDEPIVQTKAGQLRGYILDDLYTFRGIKYADAKRFQMPTEPSSWEGVKDAHSYGFVCPMLSQDTPTGELMVPHRYWPMDENCQYLNIWTKSIDANAKKPVMVWLHGGGFTAGSSIEQEAYDGENLSKHGDVVVVTLNHRLNVLGYLDLSPFGEKYKNSANVGNADIVAALKWVEANIASFGGDPDNVTLFGQSGGGMKIWSLMQTPEADGLFHKGIIQSGVIKGILDMSKTDGTSIVKAMLAQLNLSESQIEELEGLPYSELASAYNKVAPKVAARGEYVGGAPMQNEYYLGDPREVGFTEAAKKIPLIVGSVFGEFAFMPALTSEQKNDPKFIDESLSDRYGEHKDELIACFKEAYPQMHLSNLLFVDSIFRSPSMDFILKKAACPEAPVYSYMFTYEFPYDGGHVAWHCSEIPFVFKNAEMVPVCNEPGVSDELEDVMFQAWVAFARTGDPNHAKLPHWQPSTAEDEAIMLFDRTCEVRHNYDHKLIEAHDKAPFKFLFGGEQNIQH